VPDAPLASQCGSLCVDALAGDDWQHWPPELRQERGALHGSLNIVRANPDRQLGEQKYLRAVLATLPGQYEIRWDKYLTLVLGEQTIVDRIVKHVDKLLAWNNAQMPSDRTEIPWRPPVVVKTEQHSLDAVELRVDLVPSVVHATLELVQIRRG
jgi:hypothetical protein